MYLQFLSFVVILSVKRTRGISQSQKDPLRVTARVLIGNG